MKSATMVSEEETQREKEQAALEKNDGSIGNELDKEKLNELERLIGDTLASDGPPAECKTPSSSTKDTPTRFQIRLSLLLVLFASIAVAAFLFYAFVLDEMYDSAGVNIDGYHISARVAAQVKSYRRGEGIILNVHTVHHAGTTFCREVGRAPDAFAPAPSFACLSEKGITDKPGYPDINPWPYNETERNINIVRKHFHMISWEYNTALHLPLKETNWESNKLVSVYVAKDPIERLLSGGSYWQSKHAPHLLENGTLDQWWGYANDTRTGETDNLALKVLTSRDCCDGGNTDPRFLDEAKALVSRFSFVLDVACLDEGMHALANLLNITLDKKKHGLHKIHKKTPRERIPFEEVYNFLVERNRPSIELYEWSKSIGLVDCSTLPAT